MSRVRVKIHKLRPSARLPQRMSAASAGYDLSADISAPRVLRPNERALIPTGIKIEIPEGYEGQIRPRSGMAYKRGLSVINAPGTIDADYRGEVMVAMVNMDAFEQCIEPGDRVAQLVIAPVVDVDFYEGTIHSDQTARSDGGFGSTGFSGECRENACERGDS